MAVASIVSSLLACLLTYLNSDYSDQVNWAFCPESVNCICRTNLTKKSNFAIRCLDWDDAVQWCPSSKVKKIKIYKSSLHSVENVKPPNSLFQIKQQILNILCFFICLVPRCPRAKGRDSAPTGSDNRSPVVCGKSSELFYSLTETALTIDYFFGGLISLVLILS